MFEEPASRWDIAWQRTKGITRWLFALSGGLLYAYLAWEPAPDQTDNSRSSENAAIAAGPSAVKDDGAGPRFIDGHGVVAPFAGKAAPGLSGTIDIPRSNGMVHPLVQMDSVARSEAIEDENEQSPTVSPHSRSPPE